MVRRRGLVRLDKKVYAIRMEKVKKIIGKKVILKEINLGIERGTVHVLAGPNGAGKTTTLRVMLGLLKADDGRIKVLGASPGDSHWSKVRRLIGYLPEDASLYDRLTGIENLYYYAMLYTGGKREEALELVRNGAKISGLSKNVLEKRTGGYSKGMKRRLLIARTLMHKPLLAVLDEPTSGLDIRSAINVRRLLRDLAREGSTLIVTTHNLLEAQYIADQVSFIDRGKVVCTCNVNEALDMFNANNLEEAFIRATEGPRNEH